MVVYKFRAITHWTRYLYNASAPQWVFLCSVITTAHNIAAGITTFPCGVKAHPSSFTCLPNHLSSSNPLLSTLAHHPPEFYHLESRKPPSPHSLTLALLLCQPHQWGSRSSGRWDEVRSIPQVTLTQLLYSISQNQFLWLPFPSSCIVLTIDSAVLSQLC